jgi:hypothetical protein
MIASLAAVLDECDMIRFAPTQASADRMHLSYTTTVHLISTLDKAFK